jgi:hypothetical protein
LVGGDLVVPAAQVLNEGVTGGEYPQPGDGLDPAHRAQPPFQLGVVGLDAIVRIPVDVVPRGWPQLVEDARVGGCASVMTSTGTTPVAFLARWKNRRAVSVSRRVDAYTSMTCPYWSTAR